MLKKGEKLIITFSLLLLCACNDGKANDKVDLREKIVTNLGSNEEYLKIYNTMSDSLNAWIYGNVLSDSIKDEQNNFSLITSVYKIDSTFVINSTKDKIASSLFLTSKHGKTKYSHSIQEFYGAKVNNKWFFWTGGYTPIFKSSDECCMKRPLSYSQFHSKVGYGCLDANGTIRDEWFEAKFKGPGYGNYKDRYMYKSTLDGNRIDSEKEYYEYLWKRNGLGFWITKAFKDSIVQREQIEGKPLADEEKREISMAVSRKIMNAKFPLYKGKYKG
jgi:hypothetical protein